MPSKLNLQCKVIALQGEIDRLTDYILEHYPSFAFEGSAVDFAIQVMEDSHRTGNAALLNQLDEDAADGVSVAQVLGRDINALAERLAKVEDRLSHTAEGSALRSLEHGLETAFSRISAVDEFDDRLLSLAQRINTVEPMLKRAAELVDLAPRIQRQLDRTIERLNAAERRLNKLIAPERPAPGSGDAQETDVLHEKREAYTIGDSVYLPNCNSLGGAQLDAGWYICCGIGGTQRTAYDDACVEVKRERDGALFWVKSELVSGVKRHQHADMPAGGAGDWVKTDEEKPSDV